MTSFFRSRGNRVEMQAHNVQLYTESSLGFYFELSNYSPAKK